MESDPRDGLISQLRAENEELKQNERDFVQMHNQLLDIEHSFKLLQDEKYRTERDGQDREGILAKRVDNLQEDIKRLHDVLEDKHNQLKETDAELIATQAECEDRGREMEKLRRELTQAKDETSAVMEDKKTVERNLSQASVDLKAAQLEIDRLTALSDKLTQAQHETYDQLNSSTVENNKLTRRVDELANKCDQLQRESGQKDKELEVARDARKAGQKEIERLLGLYKKIQDEKQDLTQHTQNVEQELKTLQDKFEELMTQSDAKDARVRELETNLTAASDRQVDTEAEMGRVQKENEGLQFLLTKYKEDLETQKALRHSETTQKIELEQERKKLEREALSKEHEARMARRELEKVQEGQEALMDNHYQLTQELGALKEHTTLLESQNVTVNPELSLVATQRTRSFCGD